MPVVMLDQVEFSKIPALNFIVPVVTSDPTVVAADEGRVIYNTTSNTIKFCDGVTWIELGPAGAGGPPTGGASGDLTGSYPAPTIALLAVTDAKVAAANKDGAVGTPSMRTLGTGATQAAAGNDSRFSDSRAPTGNAGGDLTGTYPNPGIAAGVIVDGDINSGANIATSKINGLDTALTGKASTATDLSAGAGLTGGGTIAANRTFAVGQGTGITVNADDVAINLTYADARWLLLSGGTLTNFLTLHADPSSAMHAATKQYVDLTSQGFSFKNAVRVVSTTQRALSALTSTDGITLTANDRVLLAGQTAPAENGIWLAQSGAWTRATDADASGEIKDGTLVPVAEGTAGADSLYICTATGATPWVPGSSSSTWTRFSSLNDLTAGAGLLKTGNQIDVQSANSDMTVGADNITINSAPKWTTARTITLSGDATSSPISINGTADITIPVTVTSAGTAAKHFAGDVGAGTAPVITHNLNTRDVVVEVFRTTTPWDTVGCTIERTTVNTVTLRFATAVGAGAYRCVVTGR